MIPHPRGRAFAPGRPIVSQKPEGSMKLQILAACATLAILSAGQAMAADPITAKLAAPVAAKTKFIAGGARFNCEGDTCVALAPTAETFSACKAVAAKVGVIVAFSGRKALDEDKLADCNRTAAKAAGALARP